MKGLYPGVVRDLTLYEHTHTHTCMHTCTYTHLQVRKAAFQSLGVFIATFYVPDNDESETYFDDSSIGPLGDSVLMDNSLTGGSTLTSSLHTDEEDDSNSESRHAETATPPSSSSLPPAKASSTPLQQSTGEKNSQTGQSSTSALEARNFNNFSFWRSTIPSLDSPPERGGGGGGTVVEDDLEGGSQVVDVREHRQAKEEDGNHGNPGCRRTDETEEDVVTKLSFKDEPVVVSATKEGSSSDREVPGEEEEVAGGQGEGEGRGHLPGEASEPQEEVKNVGEREDQERKESSGLTGEEVGVSLEHPEEQEEESEDGGVPSSSEGVPQSVERSAPTEGQSQEQIGGRRDKASPSEDLNPGMMSPAIPSESSCQQSPPKTRSLEEEEGKGKEDGSFPQVCGHQRGRCSSVPSLHLPSPGACVCPLSDGPSHGAGSLPRGCGVGGGAEPV